MEQLTGYRVYGGLVGVVAAATTTALFTISGTQRVIVRKLMVFNHQPANITLQLGYDTLGAVWTPVLPDFLCLTGVDNIWTEGELPVAGNLFAGFQIDTTLVTGFAGVIACQASAAAAAPNDIEVAIEVEVIGS